MSDKREIVIALAGNPNAGKTSLFNKLTGLRAHVGNYPGVTVEQKWGYIRHAGRDFKVVDLPGTYSLNSYSLDERVARDFIINERPDLVINVVDSTNLERNLYLTVQLLELGLPVIVALNMMDIAESRGLTLDIPRLENGLGVRALPVVATYGRGVDDLLDLAAETAERAEKSWRPLEISYGRDIDEALEQVQARLGATALVERTPARWLAVKYLEGDSAVEALINAEASEVRAALEPVRSKLAAHLRTTADDDIDGAMTDRRYGFLSGLCRMALIRTKEANREFSDLLDRVLLNRLAAPVFFLAVVYGLYWLTFQASGPVVGLLSAFFEFLGGLAERGLSDGPLKSLILEGLIAGVGGVLGFAPLIAAMFIGISILEDSGYMARVAFILDRVFRAFGLHGNSVVSLIVAGGIAGGCAVPGVMAARTLRDPKERIATILVTPFMTCGAKLPVFLMLSSAFFARHQAGVMMGLTVFSWLMALVSAWLLRKFLLPGDPAPFVLELPPYRMPTVSGILLHAWERTWSYLKNAGTVVVSATVVIWLMMSFPGLPPELEAEYTQYLAVLDAHITAATGPEAGALAEQRTALKRDAEAAALRHSLAGRLGGALEPLSTLIGFDWRTNMALVGGFAAKEVVLSTLGTTYAMSAEPGLEAAPANEPEAGGSRSALIRSLGARLAADPAWSPLAAVSLMVFVLLYAPCFVTIAVIRKEIGGRWAAFSLAANTLYAYLICLVIFQGGKLLGLG